MLIQSLESNSWYPHLASSLLFCHRRSWKPSAQNVAEVAAWPRSIRKRWQLLGQWSSQCFLSWVTSFWMIIMKSWNKNEHQKASVGLLSVILFWELGQIELRFGPPKIFGKAVWTPPVRALKKHLQGQGGLLGFLRILGGKTAMKYIWSFLWKTQCARHL